MESALVDLAMKWRLLKRMSIKNYDSGHFFFNSNYVLEINVKVRRQAQN